MQTADSEWVDRLKVAAFLILYTTGMWGQAGSLLPEPFDVWYGIPSHLLGPWWSDHVPPQLTAPEQTALFLVLTSYLFALGIPLLALRYLGISAVDAGLGLSRQSGIAITLGGILISLPVGFWLLAVVPDPWGSPLQETLEFISLVPEHYLVFGVFGVLLLPGRQLDWAAVGTGQVGAVLFTITVVTLVFGLVHVGTPHTAELLTSFPLGFLFAVMTFLSGSIWPGIIAHLTLNLIPMAWVSSAG